MKFSFIELLFLFSDKNRKNDRKETGFRTVSRSRSWGGEWCAVKQPIFGCTLRILLHMLYNTAFSDFSIEKYIFICCH